MTKKITTALLLLMFVCLALVGCSGSAVAGDLNEYGFVTEVLSQNVQEHMKAWGATSLKVTGAEILSEEKTADGKICVCKVTAKNEAMTVVGDYVVTYSGKQITSVERADSFEQTVSVAVPKALTIVDSEMLKGFTEMTDLTIHANVSEIGFSAFEGCTGLKTVTINSKDLPALPTACFKGCTSLTEFTIPDSTNFIFEEAFAGCTSLTLTAPPKQVVFVGTRAFSGCASLTEVNMGDGCDTITNYAFENCTGLKKIYVGRDAAEISASAFVGCPNVEEIEIESTNNAFVLTANKMLKSRGTGHYVYSLLHEEIPLPDEAKDQTTGAAIDATGSAVTSSQLG